MKPEAAPQLETTATSQGSSCPPGKRGSNGHWDSLADEECRAIVLENVLFPSRKIEAKFLFSRKYVLPDTVVLCFLFYLFSAESSETRDPTQSSRESRFVCKSVWQTSPLRLFSKEQRHLGREPTVREERVRNGSPDPGREPGREARGSGPCPWWPVSSPGFTHRRPVSVVGLTQRLQIKAERSIL